MSSVLSITAGGMNAAMQRFQTAASNIAGGSGDLEQGAIELMMAKISLEAEARVDKKSAAKKPRDVFMYFIHEAKVRAPAAAMALIERID